jgi:uncharacterized protein with GYD domain
MPKYLVTASYTQQGVQGVMKAGGSARRDAVSAMVEAAGGRLEAFYFALGDADAYVVFDLPDSTTAAAISMAVNAVGAVQIKTTTLLTPEEIDEAAKQSIDYRPPGS